MEASSSTTYKHATSSRAVKMNKRAILQQKQKEAACYIFGCFVKGGKYFLWAAFGGAQPRGGDVVVLEAVRLAPGRPLVVRFSRRQCRR